MAGSPYRRRRVVWAVIALALGGLLYLSTRTDIDVWALPAYLKDLGLSRSSSPARLVADAKADAGRPRAQEIHGLLHFVTAHPDRTFNEDEGAIAVAGLGPVTVDAQAQVDMRVYAPDGDADWAAHVQALKTQHPLVVFSKSYCPYSKRAKALLASYNLKPAPTVVELDLRADGPIIQGILGRLTGRRTVPNVILQGESIGGSDDIMALHEEGELMPLLQKAGYAIGGA
ncbi:glutaredoxin [Phanerochaete sordida]|uniref:Glutaredoxin n=1 Tax=Phanerochaete sordida TaxID=48140 RepID=A0A9P3GHH5_9APHY|nr:glutaredoxin [Phanerochaete sordida]